MSLSPAGGAVAQDVNSADVIVSLLQVNGVSQGKAT